jgi:hypothetical protein
MHRRLSSAAKDCDFQTFLQCVVAAQKRTEKIERRPRLRTARVTRCVCEKIAQSAAEAIFVQINS